MAVDINVEALQDALRLGTTDAETAQATRLLAYATEAVEKHAPGEDVPVTIQNEAVVRLAGYLFDQPTAGRGAAYANALRNSGAAAILSPYRIHRAGSVEGSVAAQAAADEPDVDQIARDAAAANAAAIAALPAATPHVDQTARDAAAANAAAISALPAATPHVDQTARDAAAANAAAISALPAATPHVDQTARDAAAANAAAISALPAATPHVDQTARDAAAAAQATADEGGSGTPLEVATDELHSSSSTPLVNAAAHAVDDTNWSNLQADGADVVCPDTGELEIFVYAKSGLRDNSVAYAKVPAAELILTPTNGEFLLALGANRYFSFRVNTLADKLLQVRGQAGQASTDGNYLVRVDHLQDLITTVVTGVTGGPGSN